MAENNMDTPKDTRLPIGANIRKARKALGMSLRALSKASNISLSTLSKIENDAISPGFDKVVSLCHALDLDVTDLISNQKKAADQTTKPMARLSITRKGESDTIETENYISHYLCSNISRKVMVPMIAELKLESEADPNAEMIRHPGEEYIYVLEGRVKVILEYYEPVILETGDSLYIDSTMGHMYVRADKKPARVLGISLADD